MSSCMWEDTLWWLLTYFQRWPSSFLWGARGKRQKGESSLTITMWKQRNTDSQEPESQSKFTLELDVYFMRDTCLDNSNLTIYGIITSDAVVLRYCVGVWGGLWSFSLSCEWCIFVVEEYFWKSCLLGDGLFTHFDMIHWTCYAAMIYAAKVQFPWWSTT